MNATETIKPLRGIKSFIKREGRFTSAQAKALAENWPLYGLDLVPSPVGVLQDVRTRDGREPEHRMYAPEEPQQATPPVLNYIPINPMDIFGRQAPLIIEIGFGMGASFLAMIEQHPEWDFIGIEVHRPGVGAFLHQVQAKQLKNVRVYCHDAVEVLQHAIPDDCVDRICIFFPDPWHKKRHHKRRIIQPAFVDILQKKLKSGGCLHLATDWEDYAQHMLQVLQTSTLVNQSATGDYVPRPEMRPMTKYERRGERLGHVVRDMVFTK